MINPHNPWFLNEIDYKIGMHLKLIYSDIDKLGYCQFSGM